MTKRVIGLVFVICIMMSLCGCTNISENCYVADIKGVYTCNGRHSTEEIVGEKVIWQTLNVTYSGGIIVFSYDGELILLHNNEITRRINCNLSERISNNIEVDVDRILPSYMYYDEATGYIFFSAFVDESYYRVFAFNEATDTLRYTDEILNDRNANQPLYFGVLDSDTVLFSEKRDDTYSIYSYNFITKDEELYLANARCPITSVNHEYILSILG